MSELFVIEGSAKNEEEALRLTADVLYKNGCVKEGFLESCLEREKDFPTGLTEFCPVALPHTSKDFVRKEAICALRLKEPVKFGSMEDIEKKIDIRIILNMAFLDDSEHIVIISKIITKLKDETFVRKLETLPLEKLKTYLRENFLPD